MRARVIEALALTASAEAQREYQRDVPIAQVPAEVLYSWPEWLADDAVALDWFTLDERAAILSFHAAWLAVSDQPELYSLKYVDEVVDTPEWSQLATSAARALAAFTPSAN